MYGFVINISIVSYFAGKDEKRSAKKRAVYQLHSLYQLKQKGHNVSAAGAQLPPLFARDGFHSRLDSPPPAVAEFSVTFRVVPFARPDDDAEEEHFSGDELDVEMKADVSASSETMNTTSASIAAAGTCSDVAPAATATDSKPVSFSDAFFSTRPKRVNTRYNAAHVENPRLCSELSSGFTSDVCDERSVQPKSE